MCVCVCVCVLSCENTYTCVCNSMLRFFFICFGWLISCLGSVFCLFLSVLFMYVCAGVCVCAHVCVRSRLPLLSFNLEDRQTLGTHY